MEYQSKPFSKNPASAIPPTSSDHRSPPTDLSAVLSAEALAKEDHRPPPAAHLIPFSESRNDHPTNGLALCKNHHWAMDRNLIAPCPDHHWHVAKILDPRRSNGEKELIELAGKSLLLPKDPAFHPDDYGLKWRCQKLLA
jgi:hypothetical protein